MEGFYSGSTIQYKSSTKHFRYIKFYGKSKIKVYDSDNTAIYEGEEREQVLNAK